MTPDPGMDYATVEEAEAELFGAAAGGPPDDPAAEPAAAPAPAKRKRAPGPAPNPLSGRQQKLARAAMRAKAAPAPAKRAKPNTPAKADPSEVYHRGALALIGWPARGFAAAGLGFQVAAQSPRLPAPKAQAMHRHGVALSLDSVAVQLHAPALAAGAAEMALSVPWAANVLEKAAKISPFAGFIEAGVNLTFQVLVNHGFLPAGYMGTMTPEELAEAAGLEMPAPATSDVEGEHAPVG